MTARSGASALLAALGAAAGLLAPPAAQAADRLVLTPHVDVAHLYSDNVFADSESEKNDSITQIRPSLTLEGRSETGSSALVVGARVSKYWRYSELDSIDPFVRTEFTRDLTPRWSIAANAEYRKQHSTDAVSEGGQVDFYGARPDIETTSLGGQVTRRLSRSTLFLAHASFLSVNYDRGAGPEFESYTDYGVRQVGLAWQRSLSPLQWIGLSLDYEQIPLDAAESLGNTVRSSRDDQIYRLVARWSRSWTSRLAMQVEVGGRYLRTHGGAVQGLQECTDAACTPGLAVDFDTTPDPSFSFVGEADLDYDTLNGQLNLHLSRETRPSNGSQGSRNADRASVSFARGFGRRLSMNAYTSYTRTSSTGKVVQPFDLEAFLLVRGSCDREGLENGSEVCLVDVESALNEEFWTAGVQLSWRIRRRWSSYIAYDYQRSSNDRPDRGDWDASRVTFGFRWSHDLPL